MFLRVYCFFEKKECENILNQFHRASDEEKCQMYKNEYYRKILDFMLSEDEITSIKYRMNNKSKHKSRIYYKSKSYIFSSPTPQNVPECPICGSTDLSKITIAHKAGKIALFGIFGMGDNGKTWKCNNCGSKF